MLHSILFNGKTCLTYYHFCAFFQSLLTIIAQLPVFVTFFFGIKGMANLPVESFKTGGYLWFQDLTLCDPYFVLPIICSFSMLATLEVRKISIILKGRGHNQSMSNFGLFFFLYLLRFFFGK